MDWGGILIGLQNDIFCDRDPPFSAALCGERGMTELTGDGSLVRAAQTLPICS